MAARESLLLLGLLVLVWSHKQAAVAGSDEWPSSTDSSASGSGEDNATFVFVSEDGHDSQDCIDGGRDNPCQTLVYVAGLLVTHHRGVSITILGDTLEINETVQFTSISDMTLEGSPTELKCACQDCGVIFEKMDDLTIHSLDFTGCGTTAPPLKNTTIAGVFLIDCCNVAIEQSSFSDSRESGLYIYNTFGTVKIHNCTFENSGTCTECIGTSGLTIRFFKDGVWSNYTISYCTVRNNTDNGSSYYHSKSLGGGIDLSFKGESTGNVLTFEDVIVEGNKATWGGGMAIEFDKNASDNQVFVKRTEFRYNKASKAGGGIDIGYLGSTNEPPVTNIVLMEESNFTGNIARYGAGTAIYAIHTTHIPEPSDSEDSLVFKSCNWSGNEASFGSTVDISPFAYDTLSRLYFPRPKFIDCSFTSNDTEQFGTGTELNFLINTGSFAINGFEVLFQGNIHFYDHTYTPLHVTDGAITFMPGTTALFQNNTGSQGGALALYGASVLRVLPNSTLMFIDNTATGKGGAIYQSSQNHHDFISSRTCFIQNGNSSAREGEKPKIMFKGNKVGHTEQPGHAIYATTFLACYFAHYSEEFWKHTIEEVLQKIAEFEFDGNESTALASSGRYFQFDGKNVPAIPGRVITVDLSMTDEINNTVPPVYHVLRDNQCPADRQYMINRISIKSNASGNCSLPIMSVGFRALLYKINITLMKCPPGFYMDTNNSCSCSAFIKEQAYFGISACHDRKSIAYLRNGFWAGYDSDNESLLTAHCPSSFCNTQIDKEMYGIKLPESPREEELVNTVCCPHRTGQLCGQCQPGNSTFFHSPTYRCQPQKLCAWGPLFYLLSEVLPIVVLFSVIAVFDIRFTTGTASALVFFAQISDTFTIRRKWGVKEPKVVEVFGAIYRVTYGLFNFEFFNLESVSFCLWREATLLDIIAFKYISVLFAVVLLLGIVLFLNYCSCNCLNRGRKVFPVGNNRSVVHSMSAVLVMCYAQCTNISFQILTKTKLRGPGSVPKHTVTLYGGIPYLSPQHLLYALPACLCLATIVAIPPFLLLVYPAYLHLLSLCKLNEKRPVPYVSRFFIKLKPFFDSFQGCYRDKLRFFSGFYFLGRVIILAVNAFVTSTSQSIISMQVVILLLLSVYALCHPFYNTEDNTNTVLVLLNMSMIGIFTMLAYSQDGYEEQRNVVIFSLIVRLILLYLPIICVVGNLVKKLVYFYRKEKGKKSEESVPDQQNATQRVIDHSYLPYQEISVESPTSGPPPLAPPDIELSYSYTDREELLAYM